MVDESGTSILVEAETPKSVFWHELALIVANFILLGTFAVDFFIRRAYTMQFQFIILAVVVAAGLAYFLLPGKSHPDSLRSLAVSTINHIIAFLSLIFIVPIFGPYILILPLIMLSDGFRYGTNGILWNLFGQTVALVAAVLYQFDVVDGKVLADSLLYLLLLDFIGIFLWRILRADYQDRLKLEALRASARLEQDRLRSLINSMSEAVIATDNKGKITVYNGATLSLLDTNASLLGTKLKEVLKIEDSKGTKLDLISQALHDNMNINRSDVVLKISDTDSLVLEVNVAAVRPSYGQMIGEGFVITLRDITKEKSLDEQRDDFISVTSHELRTPIAIIEANLSTSLLDNMSNGMQDKTKELVEAAHENVIFLANLVGDLSTLARAEKNFLDLEIDKVEPKAIVDHIKNDYAKEAEDKGLGLQVNIDKKVNDILTSELYLKEILQNFMTNALKYSKEGTIKVNCTGDDKGNVRFAIQDTGIGISVADQKKLFTKFFRSEDYRTRETGGTGLGLYISKKLAERINGKVWCESKLNKGSTFFLEVPSIGGLAEDKTEVAQAEIDEIASNL